MRLSDISIQLPFEQLRVFVENFHIVIDVLQKNVIADAQIFREFPHLVKRDNNVNPDQ